MPVLVDENARSLLKAVPYFRALDDNALDAVGKEVVIRHYQAGEIIFLEGEPDAGLHLVTEGLCKVYRLSEGGREHVLATLRPGDSCNEVPVVDGGPNPANFAALENSIVWVISAESLSRLRRQYPALNEMIIKNLAMRCRQLVQRVYNLSFLSVTGRLAAFLLQQSEESGELHRRMTQDEIAAHLGTVREMVGRAFRELQEAELISIDRHRIEILDREGLRELT
ncbi:MAG: Crp/Fnr family transcriptional regulator [Anaerolineae bacterium]|nr:Crp/Fnr family transcriptional regulator [Anaerolineales bacterium]MCQ3974688.1 Crp/Fnr family transcriptional regulator [Anaerolineae bacterium]